MARWLVEIVGEPAVVWRYSRAFAEGDPRVVIWDEQTLVTGTAISSAQTPTEAERLALSDLSRMGGILSLLEGSARPIRTNTVWFEDDNGKRTGHALLACEVRVALEVGALPVRAQGLLAATRRHPLLDEALELWAIEPQTWSTLYKVFETLQRHQGGNLVATGAITKAQQSRFTHSAQSPVSAGLEARHFSGRYPPPSQPMTFKEAREIVRRVMTQVLDQAAATHSQS